MSEASGVDFDRPPWMPENPSDLRDILTDYLEARLDAGHRYVTVNNIRSDLDWNPMPQRIGTNLRELEREGAVEKWSNGSPATYRITIDEEADLDE